MKVAPSTLSGGKAEVLALALALCYTVVTTAPIALPAISIALIGATVLAFYSSENVVVSTKKETLKYWDDNVCRVHQKRLERTSK